MKLTSLKKNREAELEESTNNPYVTTAEIEEQLLNEQEDSILLEKFKPNGALWEFPRSNLVTGRLLGFGAFGDVYLGKARGIVNDDEVTLVAVKSLRKDSDSLALRDFYAEILLMQTLGHHEHIVEMLGMCVVDEPLLLLVEFMAHGNLRDYLRKFKKNPEKLDKSSGSPARLLQYIIDICSGMVFLSKAKCVHRDLAARNILLNDKFIAKIADFGLARDMEDYVYMALHPNRKLPTKWLAPECMIQAQFTVESDVWAFGIVMWEILMMGGIPYPGVSARKMFQTLTVERYRMPKPHCCSPELYGLMRQCWNDDPNARPTFPSLHESLTQLQSDVGLHINMEAEADYAYSRLNLEQGQPLHPNQTSTDNDSDAGDDDHHDDHIDDNDDDNQTPAHGGYDRSRGPSLGTADTLSRPPVKPSTETLSRRSIKLSAPPTDPMPLPQHVPAFDPARRLSLPPTDVVPVPSSPGRPVVNRNIDIPQEESVQPQTLGFGFNSTIFPTLKPSVVVEPVAPTYVNVADGGKPLLSLPSADYSLLTPLPESSPLFNPSSILLTAGYSAAQNIRSDFDISALTKQSMIDAEFEKLNTADVVQSRDSDPEGGVNDYENITAELLIESYIQTSTDIIPESSTIGSTSAPAIPPKLNKSQTDQFVPIKEEQLVYNDLLNMKTLHGAEPVPLSNYAVNGPIKNQSPNPPFARSLAVPQIDVNQPEASEAELPDYDDVVSVRSSPEPVKLERDEIVKVFGFSATEPEVATPFAVTFQFSQDLNETSVSDEKPQRIVSSAKPTSSSTDQRISPPKPALPDDIKFDFKWQAPESHDDAFNNVARKQELNPQPPIVEPPIPRNDEMKFDFSWQAPTTSSTSPADTSLPQAPPQPSLPPVQPTFDLPMPRNDEMKFDFKWQGTMQKPKPGQPSVLQQALPQVELPMPKSDEMKFDFSWQAPSTALPSATATSQLPTQPPLPPVQPTFDLPTPRNDEMKFDFKWQGTMQKPKPGEPSILQQSLPQVDLPRPKSDEMKFDFNWQATTTPVVAQVEVGPPVPQKATAPSTEMQFDFSWQTPPAAPSAAPAPVASAPITTPPTTAAKIPSKVTSKPSAAPVPDKPPVWKPNANATPAKSVVSKPNSVSDQPPKWKLGAPNVSSTQSSPSNAQILKPNPSIKRPLPTDTTIPARTPLHERDLVPSEARGLNKAAPSVKAKPVTSPPIKSPAFRDLVPPKEDITIRPIVAPPPMPTSTAMDFSFAWPSNNSPAKPALPVLPKEDPYENDKVDWASVSKQDPYKQLTIAPDTLYDSFAQVTDEPSKPDVSAAVVPGYDAFVPKSAPTLVLDDPLYASSDSDAPINTLKPVVRSANTGYSSIDENPVLYESVDDALNVYERVPEERPAVLTFVPTPDRVAQNATMRSRPTASNSNIVSPRILEPVIYDDAEVLTHISTAVEDNYLSVEDAIEHG